jgi:cell wall-associated NlpC family hydrolase
MIHYKQKLLQEGKIFETSEKGNSMVPLIKSGQKHILEPIKIEDVQVGDIVFCKVKGSYFTHLVTAKNDKKGVQISNNHGYVNGWTKQVWGKVKEIL